MAEAIQPVLTIGGSIVGAYYGGPVGGAIGGMAGGMLGSVITNLIGQSDSPTVPIMHVTGSTYGKPINRVYGTMRVACNIIWSTHLNPVPVTAGSGGIKGVGTPSQYTYTVSFAVGVCAGPIVAVQRIWADNKLIHDARPVNNSVSAASRCEAIKIFLGTETQLPSKIIESYMGPNYTPPFRGLAYVLFDVMQLQDFGNHIPNIECEVIALGVPAYPTATIEPPGTPSAASISYFDNVRNVAFISTPISGEPSETVQWQKINVPDQSLIAESAPNMPGAETGLEAATCVGYNGNVYNQFGLSGDTLYQMDGISLVISDTLPLAAILTKLKQLTNTPQYMVGLAAGLSGSGLYLIDEGDALPPTVTPGQNLRLVSSIGTGLFTDTAMVYFSADQGIDNIVWALRPAAGTNNATIDFITFADTGEAGIAGGLSNGIAVTGSLDISSYFTAGSGAGTLPNYTTAGVVSYIAELDAFLVGVGSGTGGYILIDRSTQTLIETEFTGTGGISEPDPSTHDVYGISGNSITEFDPVDWAIDNTWDMTGFGLTASTFAGQGLFYDTGADSLWGHNTAAFLSRTAAQDAALGDIITDICEQTVVLSPAETWIDVTSVDGVNVHGFALDKLGNARAALAPLAAAFDFEVVESDYKLKFVKCGASPTVTIPATDLSAHVSGQKRPDTLVNEWPSSEELPFRLLVHYSNLGRQYQPDVGSAVRFQEVIVTDEQKEIEIAVALEPDEANAIAMVRLYLAWINRMVLSFSLGIKYLYLDPTDVITVTNDAAVPIVCKLTQMDFGANNVCAMKGVVDYPPAHIPPLVSVGASDLGSFGPGGGTGGGDTITAVASLFYLLDCPAPLDVYASDGGFFIVAGPQQDSASSTWGGIAILKSIDGGASFQNFSGTKLFSCMGVARTVLQNPRSWEEWDETSSVEIFVTSGSTEFTTISQLAALNGGNFAYLGGELINFTTATENSDGSFTLSGLIRGRRGTDLSVPTHAIAEPFVLFAPGTWVDITSESSEIGLSREYEGITPGAKPPSGPIEQFVDTGKRLWPYTVVSVAGSRDGSSNLTITWIRRARLNGEVSWNDYVTEIPLGEVSESYAIDIYKSGAVVRTLTATSPTVEYSAADQVADFGSAQSSVACIIYQINAVVGRGFGAAVTV